MQFALFLRSFEQKCKCSFIHLRSQLEAAPSLTANRRQQRLLLRLKPCFDSTIDDETHFSDLEEPESHQCETEALLWVVKALVLDNKGPVVTNWMQNESENLSRLSITMLWKFHLKPGLHPRIFHTTQPWPARVSAWWRANSNQHRPLFFNLAISFFSFTSIWLRAGLQDRRDRSNRTIEAFKAIFLRLVGVCLTGWLLLEWNRWRAWKKNQSRP